MVAVAGVAAWLIWQPNASDTVTVDEPLPAANVATSDLPVGFGDATLYATPWEATPKVADGTMLGLGQHGDRLRFTAVRADGTELWHAERPLACAGFTVTMAGDRPIAVLNDSEASSDDTTLLTTASGFDLHTGELVWGPVEVPGPNYGPGLVYASAPDEYFGDAGPLIALDGRTGATMFTEPEDSQRRIVGEFDGMLVVADSNTLTGQNSDGELLWTHDATVLPWVPEGVRSVSGIDPGGRWAVLGTNQNDDGALFDTTTGTIHAFNVSDALADRDTETVAYISGQDLAVTSASRHIQWSRPADGRTISAIGKYGIVVEDDDDLDLLNLDDGSPLYPGDPARLKPTASTSTQTHTATMLTDGEQFILAIGE